MIPLCVDKAVRAHPLEPASPRRPRPGRRVDLEGKDRRVREEPLRPRAGPRRSRHRGGRGGGPPPPAASRPAQVALAWIWHKPAVVAPIVGASKPHHLEDAAAAMTLKLTPRGKSPRSRPPNVPHAVGRPPMSRLGAASRAIFVAAAVGAVRLQGSSGVVFDDRNGNGVRDPGEPGLAGVAVSNGVDVA